jgi:hypothetical protein
VKPTTVKNSWYFEKEHKKMLKAIFLIRAALIPLLFGSVVAMFVKNVAATEVGIDAVQVGGIVDAFSLCVAGILLVTKPLGLVKYNKGCILALILLELTYIGVTLLAVYGCISLKVLMLFILYFGPLAGGLHVIQNGVTSDLDAKLVEKRMSTGIKYLVGIIASVGVWGLSRAYDVNDVYMLSIVVLSCMLLCTRVVEYVIVKK